VIKEITARTLLSSVRQPDPIFGLKYNMNLYRGCQHLCIYCDSRSECYQIEDFNHDILVKVNAIELLDKELSKKRIKGAIGLGSMNDPYMPLEAKRKLARGALEVVTRHQFPVHILTKSDLVLRDLDLLRQIHRVYAAVGFTIATADDDLAHKLEPGAPFPSRRFKAMQALAAEGILTEVSMMPILPFIEDNADNLRAIVSQAHDNGAKYIIPWISVTLRDRQRAHYYTQLDRLFPGLRQRYERAYGERYEAVPPNAKRLWQFFNELCQQVGLATRIPVYTPEPVTKQLSLF
jgi:DNA repair photolyase